MSAYRRIIPLGLPWSGDVWQQIMSSWFSPSITYNYAGDLRVEEQVITNVSSFGKQLGWINEILLALAKNEKLPEKTIRKLSDANERIERIKTELSLSALDEASNALDRLKREAPEEFRRVILDSYKALHNSSGD